MKFLITAGASHAELSRNSKIDKESNALEQLILNAMFLSPFVPLHPLRVQTSPTDPP